MQNDWKTLSQIQQNLNENSEVQQFNIKIRDMILFPPQNIKHIQESLELLKLGISTLQFDYLDPLFKPQIMSLTERTDSDKYKDIKWNRLQNLAFTQENSLINQIESKYEFQRNTIINYSSMCSAGNILMSQQKYIWRIFETTALNSLGITGVWLNRNGQWKLVISDDLIPFRGKECVLTMSNSGYWSLIVEKALAQFYGRIEQLQTVTTVQLLSNITGSPCEIFQEGTSEDWWLQIKKWKEREFLIFTQNPPSSSNEVLQMSESSCLQRGIAYVVLDSRIVENDSENIGISQIILLKASNQALIWTGSQWSYKREDQWTKEFIDMYQIEQPRENDLTFWMSVDELFTHFSRIGACKVHQKYQFTWLSLSDKYQPKNPVQNCYHIIEIKAKRPVDIIITLHQKDKDQNKKNEEYSPVRILIGKENKDQRSHEKSEQEYEYVCGKYQFSRELVLQEYLEEGSYLLLIEIGRNCDQKKIPQSGKYQTTVSFQFNNLHEDPKLVNDVTEASFLKIEKSIVSSIAMRINQRSRTYAAYQEPQIRVFSELTLGTQTLQETVQMEELENMIICDPFVESQSFTVTVQPGSELVVLYKFDPRGEKFAFKAVIRAALEVKPGIFQACVLDAKFKDFKDQNVTPTQNSTLLKNERQSQYEESKKQNQREKVIQFELQSEQELADFMRRQVSPALRRWENTTVPIQLYKFQHPEGLILLYINQSNFIYREILEFIYLDNLKFDSHSQIMDQGQKITFSIKPGNYIFIYFGVQTEGISFQYEFKTVYDLIPCII